MNLGLGHDKLLPQTCEAIVTTAAQCIDAEPSAGVVGLQLPDGQIIGKQIIINASELNGPLNTCRLSVLDAAQAPEGEVARIEYEHDKETKHGMHRVYSIQSVRRRAGELVLLEDFLAESGERPREADFRPIDSEAYGRDTVLKTLQEWTHYRAWQLQQANLHKQQG